jgi:hypothetical protein
MILSHQLTYSGFCFYRYCSGWKWRIIGLPEGAIFKVTAQS